MRNCPYCAEVIQLEAIKCKHCGSMLTSGAAPSIPLVRPMVSTPMAHVHPNCFDRNWGKLYGAAAGAVALVLVLAVAEIYLVRDPDENALELEVAA